MSGPDGRPLEATSSLGRRDGGGSELASAAGIGLALPAPVTATTRGSANWCLPRSMPVRGGSCSASAAARRPTAARACCRRSASGCSTPTDTTSCWRAALASPGRRRRARPAAGRVDLVVASTSTTRSPGPAARLRARAAEGRPGRRGGPRCRAGPLPPSCPATWEPTSPPSPVPAVRAARRPGRWRSGRAIVPGAGLVCDLVGLSQVIDGAALVVTEASTSRCWRRQGAGRGRRFGAPPGCRASRPAGGDPRFHAGLAAGSPPRAADRGRRRCCRRAGGAWPSSPRASSPGWSGSGTTKRTLARSPLAGARSSHDGAARPPLVLVDVRPTGCGYQALLWALREAERRDATPPAVTVWRRPDAARTTAGRRWTARSPPWSSARSRRPVCTADARRGRDPSGDGWPTSPPHRRGTAGDGDGRVGRRDCVGR